ncbi:hypothetical protein CDAR_108821 [Caerostris darwini]|uniref:C2H2-type domain-containing protein n=1 Tax=Caerostris darwini TaxID=1538125 RepID=A0AAV4V5I9_9ARAC|nr:hypothetical protein CDAR_108821 [Caerostris darwini]
MNPEGNSNRPSVDPIISVEEESHSAGCLQKENLQNSPETESGTMDECATLYSEFSEENTDDSRLPPIYYGPSTSTGLTHSEIQMEEEILDDWSLSTSYYLSSTSPEITDSGTPHLEENAGDCSLPTYYRPSTATGITDSDTSPSEIQMEEEMKKFLSTTYYLSSTSPEITDSGTPHLEENAGDCSFPPTYCGPSTSTGMTHLEENAGDCSLPPTYYGPSTSTGITHSVKPRLKKNRGKNKSSRGSKGIKEQRRRITEFHSYAYAYTPSASRSVQRWRRRRTACYNCPQCPYRTHHSGHLRYHMRVHSGEKPYECEVCGNRFTVKCNLKNHLLKHNIREECRKCDRCHTEFVQERHLDSHKRVHTDKEIECSKCKRTFTNKCDLTMHVRTHVSDEEWESGDDGDPPSSQNAKPHHRSPPQRWRYKCPMCSYSTPNTTHLREHILWHSGKRPHACFVCDQRLRGRGNLRRHLFTHAAKEFRCEMCHKRFGQKRYLNLHRRTHGKKKFVCDACGMGFTLKRNLVHHRERHVTEDEHQFSACEDQLAHRDELHAYERPHSAEKPRRCHICDRGFSKLASLSRAEAIVIWSS